MNHDRVNISYSPASCGIIELSRLSDDADENLFVIANSFYHPSKGNPPAFVLFSNLAEIETTAHKLKERISALNFGSILESPSQVNPKTGHVIKVWLWNVDHKPFRDWYKQCKIEKLRNF